MATNAVADSDLEIGGGAGALKTKLPKRSIKLPQACGPRLLSKNKVGLAPWAPLLYLPLQCGNKHRQTSNYDCLPLRCQP